MPDAEHPDCNVCGSNDWWALFTSTYTGDKGVAAEDTRDPTTKETFECRGCSASAKKFTDGVSGEVTYTGAMRHA